MVSQATKEYLKNMYERDMSNDEIIIQRLNSSNESSQEIVERLDTIIELLIDKRDIFCGVTTCKHHIDLHKLFGGCQVPECDCKQFYRKEVNEAIEISDYPSGISKDHHLHIQQEGLSSAAEDLLKATRAGNQNAVNEATYCALIRLIHIVDNLAKRNFGK